MNITFYFIISRDLIPIFSIVCLKRKTLDGSSDFFKARVSTTTGTAFIFLSVSLLTQLRTTKQIQADGTFKTVPNLFYQLFTLHFKAYKKVTILTLSLLRLLDCFVFASILRKVLSSCLRFNE